MLRDDAAECRRTLVVLVFVFAAALPSTALGQSQHATSPSNPTVLALHNGRNAADLLGDRGTGEILVSRRENFNAHSFSVVEFRVLASASPGDSSATKEWQILPFFGGPNDNVTGTNAFTTFEGADCTLADLRVVRAKRGTPVEVVVGRRDLGESFADSAAVRFEYYRIEFNRDGAPGAPAYWFRYTGSRRAHHKYCDINDAFDRELHLGKAGIELWDGPR